VAVFRGALKTQVRTEYVPERWSGWRKMPGSEAGQWACLTILGALPGRGDDRSTDRSEGRSEQKC